MSFSRNRTGTAQSDDRFDAIPYRMTHIADTYARMHAQPQNTAPTQVKQLDERFFSNASSLTGSLDGFKKHPSVASAQSASASSHGSRSLPPSPVPQPYSPYGTPVSSPLNPYGSAPASSSLNPYGVSTPSPLNPYGSTSSSLNPYGATTTSKHTYL